MAPGVAKLLIFDDSHHDVQHPRARVTDGPSGGILSGRLCPTPCPNGPPGATGNFGQPHRSPLLAPLS